MEKKKPRPYFLLSNDDGIEARGIQYLIEILRPYADLIVVAPDRARSGASASLQISPVTISEIAHDEGCIQYACSGTPTDCIKIALQFLCSRKPDVVISGINHGANSSISVHYSGTVGAAIEGAIHNIPSLALSLCDNDTMAPLEPCGKVIKSLIERMTAQSEILRGHVLNVNIPAVKLIQGIRICSQGNGSWEHEFEMTEHDGGEAYQLAGVFEPDARQLPSSDLLWIQKGYATVVPCKIDITHYELMRSLNDWDCSW